MKRLLLYLIIVIILFSGLSQLKDLWEKNGKSLDATVADVRTKVSGWVDSATEKGKELQQKGVALKAALDVKLKEANDRYDKIRTEIDSINQTINDKKNQLEKTLNQIEEAKKALDALTGSSAPKPATSNTPQ